MNVFYMNQGGGGDWGAVPYAQYDLILLAESAVIKQGFELVWKSTALPVMSVQVPENSGRVVTKVTDLDATAQEVRPMVTFEVTKGGFRVVFMHLKSGSIPYASKALVRAVEGIQRTVYNKKSPILWIGDFNRADGNLMQEIGATLLVEGGGQAKWELDRAYITGDWAHQPSANVVTKASDHGHVGILFQY